MDLTRSKEASVDAARWAKARGGRQVRAEALQVSQGLKASVRTLVFAANGVGSQGGFGQGNDMV